MRNILKILPYIFYILAIFVLIIGNLIVISDGITKWDVLGLIIPEPPIWVSFIPGGSYIGFIFEWFSLLGLVLFIIFIILLSIGMYLSKIIKKKT